AFRLQLLKFALVFSDRRQGASDARKRTEVGACEAVRSGDRCGPGIVEVPGSERAMGVNFAYGFRVCQLAAEGKRLVHADVAQTETMDDPVESILFRVLR